MSATALTGLALGSCLGLTLLLLLGALRGWRPSLRFRDAGSPPKGWASSYQRSLAAAGAGVGALVVTRWPVAAVAVAALVLFWPIMFGAGKVAADQILRLEALATWTESLRDSIAGSVGLEEAIRHSLAAAPKALTAHLERLDGRLRVQIPLQQALEAFAEELEDASADLVVGALMLNARLRGPGLVATLTALASSTREELDLRRRIEEGRKSLRRTALIILGATSVFAGGLTVLSREYVAPYSTPTGQVMLALVVAVFAAGLVWIRSAADLRVPVRFLGTSGDIDGGATLSGSGGDRS